MFIDPSRNSGQKGFVSAVILCFGHLAFLPPTSTVSILKMSLEASNPQAGEDQRAELKIQDGLRGSGQPIASALNVRGESVPCNLSAPSWTVRFHPGPSFLRGNANNDSTVDISDSLLILRSLFLSGGLEIPCKDAADANDDGTVDISDGIYLLLYLFLGAPPPPQPFPDCGVEPEADRDDMGCLEEAMICP